jgi:hypothetical protein
VPLFELSRQRPQAVQPLRFVDLNVVDGCDTGILSRKVLMNSVAMCGVRKWTGRYRPATHHSALISFRRTGAEQMVGSIPDYLRDLQAIHHDPHVESGTKRIRNGI